ncbi:glycosyltransferase [Psychrobacter faecalis]|uniref:glycosyltransferase n=1 Tax=Psychrobacter faecalis TaxID=180588 RepID=UPI0018DF4798|nr:glycosyltransferase [Psychrobacter faecalis]
MNTAFLVTNLDSGGIENYLLRYLTHESHNFKKSYIICKSGTTGQLESRFLEIPNIEIIRLKVGYFNIVNLKNLFFFYKRKRISAVCDFTGNFSGLSLLVAYLAAVPKRIAFYRSSTSRFPPTFLRNKYNSLMNLLVKIFATDILSNSKAALDNYFCVDLDLAPKFEVINNGIDAGQFLSKRIDLRQSLNIDSSSFIIGHTGRYNPAKNHKTILNVAEKLIKTHSDIYFILCGNGVKKNLTSEVVSRDLSGKVLLFENREDIPSFLETMNCFFFPSITEGQPNSLIEALIIGLPYVASNIPSIQETVFDDENLYSPMDSHAFAKALIKLYNERPEKSMSMRKKATEKFSHKKTFGRFTARLCNI